MKKILLVGCGHMGGALANAWIKSAKYSLTVVDPVKFKKIKNKNNKTKTIYIKSVSEIESFTNFDFIIVAIKPIDLNSLLLELEKFKFNRKTSFISVISGKKISLFQKKLKNINNFFRVMPNMPASISESMNCIVSSKGTSKFNKIEVKKLFALTGKSIFLNNENQIDMATAISGSGPGFVFNIIDAMEKAAIKLGFNRITSKTIVHQTFKGSINLLLQGNKSAESLVKTVATKGGTTEAGLKVMKKNNIHKVFISLVNASYKRAKQQGSNNAKR
tara:strand:- start:242 stop:1066 length:825 start_codon:yes stop_codon:yes gene_type:complete